MKAIKIGLIMSFMACNVAWGQFSISFSHDKYRMSQLKSETVTQWRKKKFKPQWYYLLLHNKYRKGRDRRTTKELGPETEKTIVIEGNYERARDSRNSMYKNSEKENLVKEADLAYSQLYEKEFSALDENSWEYLAKMIALEFDPVEIGELNLQRKAFMDSKSTIKSSYVDMGEKNQQYETLLGDFRRYVESMRLLTNYLETLKKNKI